VHDSFPSIVDGSLFAVDKKDDSDSSLYELVGRRVPDAAAARADGDGVEQSRHQSPDRARGAARANVTAHALGADSILVLRGVEDGLAYRAGRNNTTTARDLGVLLAAIAQNRAASPAACAEMLAILGRQHFKEGIPRACRPMRPCITRRVG